MSTRPAALAQRAPAPSVDRLALVLAAGLARLDISAGAAADIGVKPKLGRKGPAASAAGGDEGDDGRGDDDDRRKARLAAQGENLLKALIAQYRKSGDMERIPVAKRLAKEGYLKPVTRDDEKIFVRTFIRVSQPIKWKYGVDGAKGEWVGNEKHGQPMNWIEICAELDDKTGRRHAEVMRAMSLKRQEMVEKKFEPRWGKLPAWTKRQAARSEAQRTINEDALEDGVEEGEEEEEGNPFQPEDANDPGQWDMKKPKGPGGGGVSEVEAVSAES